MPYFLNEATGTVVNISDAENPKNGDRMAELVMNTPSRSYKDADGNWKSRGFRPATPAEIKAHQKQEADDAKARAVAVEERKKRNMGMHVNTIDAESLVKAISAKPQKGKASASDGE